MNFTPCEKNGAVEGFALVKSCDKKNAKNGTVYLDAVLSDKDSEIVAKLWDFKEDTMRMPAVNTVIKVRGLLQQYNGADQFIIQRMRPVCESDKISINDFVKSADYSGENMYAALYAIASAFSDKELSAVVTAIYEEHKDKHKDHQKYGRPVQYLSQFIQMIPKCNLRVTHPAKLSLFFLLFLSCIGIYLIFNAVNPLFKTLNTFFYSFICFSH